MPKPMRRNAVFMLSTWPRTVSLVPGGSFGSTRLAVGSLGRLGLGAQPGGQLARLVRADQPFRNGGLGGRYSARTTSIRSDTLPRSLPWTLAKMSNTGWMS